MKITFKLYATLSDYLPPEAVQNAVEVWDGTAWQSVWQSGSSPGIQDNAWNTMIHNDHTSCKLGPAFANASVLMRPVSPISSQPPQMGSAMTLC